MIARCSDWTAEQVAAAVGGQLRGDRGRRLLGVATDTRDALAGTLFVALTGERFDAHAFLDQALSSGAQALLIRKGLPEVDLLRWSAVVPVIEVADTLWALGQLASALRRRRPEVLVLALTGSNGKTSTKEMLAAITSEARPTLKTEGNLNNLIGLPMTLLGLLPEHQVAVLEMGMNARGEIARLTEISAPDVGMIVNIGPAHIGELGSQEAVALAKGELFLGLARGATAVVNLDDPWVEKVAGRIPSITRRTFGCHPAADVRLVRHAADASGEGQELELSLDGRPLVAHLPYPGRHNAINAAAAVAAATARLSLPVSAIERGLASAARVAGRLVAEGLGPYWLIDDCYNANAASMIAAIETVAERVAQRGGRLVALLGEMRELGEFSSAEHHRVGLALGRASAAVVAVFGPDAGPIASGAREGGLKVVEHEPVDDARLFAWLRRELAPGDVILVKGSRGIRMERFIARLRKEVA